MTQLIVLVCMYMLVSVGIGLWAARRVRNTADYALAGRSLPLAMVITATFATWFGSETVLGLPGRFIEGGISGVIEEPFGSGMALILVGMFFARKLYKMDLLTISDFYRRRYGRKIELACSIFIIVSYRLGGSAGRGPRARVKPHHRRRGERLARHDHRHLCRAFLYGLRRYVVCGVHGLLSDAHHRARPCGNRVLCG